MAAKDIDWDKIEPLWRAGIKTKQEISKEFGVSRAAMDKHFGKLGIARDLTDRIRAKAESLVAQAAVTSAVTQKDGVTTAKEAAIVEANANVQAVAMISHRQDVGRARSVLQKLFGELESLMDGIGDLEEIAAVLASEDEGRMQDLLRKVTALPTKADVAKKLIEAMRIAVELERKVLRIKDDDGPEDGARIMGESVAAGLTAAEAYRRMIGG